MGTAFVPPAWLTALALALSPQTAGEAQDGEARTKLEEALRRYFAAEVDGPALRAALAAARGREELLAEVLRTKSFLAPSGALSRRGIITAQHRFEEAPDVPEPGSPAALRPADNRALFFGPAQGAELCPLVVYVPDALTTASYERELEREGTARGRFVFLVPDDEQDNEWSPTLDEHRRHVGPLRDLLLSAPIDPDRVYLVGSGRGGHVTWAVGLLYADRWAGLFPCNGGIFPEGGYKASGGVFLENARSLALFTVYNTSFDHGIDSCRMAGRKFREWGFRFEAVEEPQMRTMGLAEAMAKLEPVVRDAHPRTLVKRFNHLDAGEHYWLRALDREPREWDPGKPLQVRRKWPTDPQEQLETVWDEVARECARIEGSIQGERITVTAHGVGRLRVYFDPELVDYGRKVTVTVNGKTHAPLALERSAEVLLRHVHETGDTSRLYWAFRDYGVRPAGGK